MRNYIWLALQMEENGKFYACGRRVSTSENIKHILNDPRIISANYCTTKKELERIILTWRDGYKRDGVYMFDETPF